MEEVLGQDSVHAVAWLLLTAFIQVYSNGEQQKKQKDVKNVQFGRERRVRF